ncbi:hypothetical protein COCSUDRAFT_39376 [Coccomyxa subellipsoidea C-169]|uniref:MalT-like TPR region domain-containing protein n=1 Tax=Coccomyxa subellipsoidea (strain C-169) TaxID=574566 RepID=I0ZAY7_COCSC|nr:hypothetical protein COCSUDRAFT_39376 [Coccomyxa subellipsoidea C-169]EIE27806.1 hypothetical protein COCSUDRAFT_39376 [Coccomyxa subellipsoidea C-169]|eukprot:XP_005652350.1 hypothetical protein COCSUDRAFT_39376 [Coccomyxa subellipsoidea C-169]
MSLSDYSSDDSLEEEPPIAVEAIKGVARSARTGGPSSMNTSSRSMAGAALAGLALAGITAGTLLFRKYLKTSRADAKELEGEVQGKDGADAGDRKELRRKRPVGGDIKESPRQSAPFMARTESTSSVGPLRKQPRRDTSEDSEGGDAMGASPKGGTPSGHRRSLRKNPSTNGRHRRPPRRAAGPSGNSPAGTGSESESNRGGPAASAKREAAVQPPPAAAAPAAAAAAPAGDARAAPEKAGSAAATDLMAKYRGSQPSAAAPQESSKSSSKSGENVHKTESFPDLVLPTISPTVQLSLDTFTAEMDVLEQAIEAAGNTTPQADQISPAAKPQEEGKPVAKGADAKNGSAAAAEGGKGAAATGKHSKEEKEAAPKDASKEESTGKAAKDVAKLGGALKEGPDSKVTGGCTSAAAAGEEGSPADREAEDRVAALQEEIDAQDDLPAAKDLVSPAAAETETAPAAGGSRPAAEAAKSEGGKSADGSGKPKEAAGKGAAAKTGGKAAEHESGIKATVKQEEPEKGVDEKGAAAGETVSEGSGEGAAASGKGAEGALSGALSAEPSLLPDGRAAAEGNDALGEAARLDLSSAEADAVSRAVTDAAEQPSDGDASAVTKPAGGDASAGGLGEERSTEEKDGGEAQGKGETEEPAGKSKGGTKGGKKPQDSEAATEAGINTAEAKEPQQDPAASEADVASANGTDHSAEQESTAEKAEPHAAPEASKPGAKGSANEGKGDSSEGKVPEGDAKPAPAFDPLGMDEMVDDSAEVPAQKEAGNGHLQEEERGAADDEQPRNQAESNVALNLAVALRIISEKGNLAAAERTLQKSLGAVREDSAGTVRPQFRSRLAGTLADVIARAEQTAGLGGKAKKENSAGRSAEIVELLTYAFEASKETGDGSLRARESWRLGAALAEAEDFEAAHALFQAELAHWDERCGPADPRAQHCRTWLADVLTKLGRKEDAQKLLTDAAEALEKEAERAASSKPEKAGSSAVKEMAGDDGSELPGHDLTPAAAASVTAAKCYVHLAQMQDADEEFDAAAGSARKAVGIMEGTFGEGSPRTSTAYGTLASILKHQGKEEGLREALKLYETLQQIAEEVHGLRNSHAAMAHRAIADVHQLLKEYGEAVSHTEKAVQVAGSVHGRDHPVMESYWQAVAEAKQAAGDKDGARDANRQALRVRSHSQRGGHGAAGGGGGRGARGGGGSGGRRGRGRGRR